MRDSRIRSVAVGRGDLALQPCFLPLLREVGRAGDRWRAREREYFPTFRKYLPFHIWNFCRCRCCYCCCTWPTQNERYVGIARQSDTQQTNFLEVRLNGRRVVTGEMASQNAVFEFREREGADIVIFQANFKLPLQILNVPHKRRIICQIKEGPLGVKSPLYRRTQDSGKNGRR